MRREPSAAKALIAMLACASPTALAQNLLANGEFDHDVSGWINPEPPAATWLSMDVDGLATSGSARLINDDAEAGNRHAVLYQCFAIGPGRYRLNVAGWAPPQSVDGRLVVNATLYVASTCTGGFVSGGGYFIPVSASWQRTEMIVENMLTPAGYVGVTLSIEKDPAGGSFVGQVDAVRFAEVSPFVDGFE